MSFEEGRCILVLSTEYPGTTPQYPQKVARQYTETTILQATNLPTFSLSYAQPYSPAGTYAPKITPLPPRLHSHHTHSQFSTHSKSWLKIVLTAQIVECSKFTFKNCTRNDIFLSMYFSKFVGRVSSCDPSKLGCYVVQGGRMLPVLCQRWDLQKSD